MTFTCNVESDTGVSDTLSSVITPVTNHFLEHGEEFPQFTNNLGPLSTVHSYFQVTTKGREVPFDL